MKNVLCMAAVALLAASCSNNDENVPTPEGKINATAINLTQTVKGVTTKAVVTNGSEVTATVVMVDASSTTADWSAFNPVTSNTVNSGGSFESDDKRATVSSAKFTAGTTTDVSLAPSLYYPTSNHSHLAAVSPKGTVNGQTIEIDPLDGMQDVMYAGSVDAGTSSSKTENLNLSFEHLTTQLNFAVKLTKAASNGAWNGNASVKSITIQKAQLPKAVAFANGTVTWTDAASLLVPGISSLAFNETATTAGNPVMIQASSEVMVNVTITGGDGKDYDYNNVVIMKDQDNKLTTGKGNSHLITLTVTEPTSASSATEITTTATVKEWVAGDAGSGELK